MLAPIRPSPTVRVAWRRILSPQRGLVCALTVAPDPPTPSSCSGIGRPGEEDDLPVALQARAPRRAELPLVGVAFSDWDDQQMRQHAREAIVAAGVTLDESVFRSFAARMRFVKGDYGEAATFETVKQVLGGAQHPLFYLEIPPSLFERVVLQLHAAGLTPGCRVVIEKPFGHDLVSARALNVAAVGARRGADLPHRPLYGQGPGAGPARVALRQRHVRADLEPPLREQRADHHVRVVRCRGPRRVLRFGRHPEGRGAEPPDADPGTARDGPAGDRRRRRAARRADARVPCDRRSRPRASCAASIAATSTCRVASDSPAETFWRCLEIDSWRWAGVPFFIRAGKALAHKATEVRVVFKRAAAPRDRPRQDARARTR